MHKVTMCSFAELPISSIDQSMYYKMARLWRLLIQLVTHYCSSEIAYDIADSSIDSISTDEQEVWESRK